MSYSEDVSAGADQPPAPYPSRAYAWWVIAVLFIAMMVSYVDRQIPALIVDGMRRDLGINDAQAGWMYGGFAIFYAIAGIPIAWLADRKSRKLVISVGIILWSFMTLTCGLARNFWQLLAARIGVGIGEATLGPTTHSLIGDYFPRPLIPRALSVFQIGAVVGSGLAFYVVGIVLDIIAENPPGAVPLLGELYDWQWTFIYVGAPGLLVVLLMLTVREPLRRLASNGATSSQTASFQEILGFYRLNWKTFLTHHVGFSLLGLIGWAFVFWTPTFFSRVHDLPVGESARTFGLIFMVFGAAGVLWAAYLGEWFARRGRKDAYILAGLIGGALALPFVLLIQFMPNPTWAFVLYAPAMFFVNSPFGMANGALPVITPPNMRARVAALYSLIGSFFGMALGPVLGGVLNDQVFTSQQGVRYSIMTMAVVCGSLGVGILWIGRKHYAQSMRRADRWDDSPEQRED